MLNRLHINETLIQRKTSIIWFICISLGTIYEPIDHVIFCHHTLRKPTKNYQKRGTLLKPSLSAESEFQSPYQSDSVPLVLVRINESPRYSDFLKYFENNCVYEDDNEKRLMPLRSLNSGWWIVLQILWRFLFSFGVALLVFYIATQPPRPDISIRVICILY